MISIYIHIPFCSNICSYCDFSKIYYNKNYVSKYLDSLEGEIKSRYNGEIVKTLYIGGGTPSSLDILELKRLFEIISIFKLDKDCEFTIEANIENLDVDKIKLFSDNKVNRVSLGVQSFNNDNIKYLNRKHNKEDVFNVVNLLKENKINNINIDLIYGIDNNIEKLKKDIDYFLELDIPHISCYSLIIENNTVLSNKETNYIDEDIEYEMYKYIESKLEEYNYIHYEVSNYSKEGYQSKHNLVYWNNEYYYGFGLSAVSYIDNYRITNTKNFTKYLNNEYIYYSEYEDKDIAMDNELMLGLRKLEGFNLLDFKNKYDVDLEEIYDIDNLINGNYLINENDCLKINKDYIYLSNEILLKINKK